MFNPSFCSSSFVFISIVFIFYSSTGEDYDDEVFIGPVGHKEKCISVNVTSSIKNTSVRSNWSPLSGDQLEAICEEAQKLAYQMQHSEPAQTETTGKEQNNVTEKNEFVQDSVVKLSMLCCDPPASPIKRQTFCIQESPLKQLPPAIQSRLLRAPSPNSRGSTARPTATAPRRSVSARPTAPKRLASPADPAARTKPTLRGKTGIGVSGVLPSRPPAPTQAPRPTTKSQTNKTRLQPLSKVRRKQFVKGLIVCTYCIHGKKCIFSHRKKKFQKGKTSEKA